MADTGTAPQLRPLALGEILDAAFKVYTRNFKTLWLTVLVPVVPIVILTTLVTASTNPDAFNPTTAVDPTAPQPAVSGAQVAGVAVTTLLTLLLVTLATAACTRAVAGAYLGERIGWQESLRFALGKLLPVIAVSLLIVVLAGISLLALLVGAIYVGVRLAVGTPALLIEDIGPIAALKRSWALVKGRWWSTFGLFLITTLLVSVIGLLLQALLLAPLIADSDNQVLGGALTALGGVVSNVLVLPLQAAVFTILYFDLRVRKEGFDLQLLARDMGGTSPEEVGRSAGLGGDSPSGFAPPDPGGGGFAPPAAPEERGSS